MSLLQSNGCWTWFNDPRAIYDPVTDSYLIGWINTSGNALVGRYRRRTKRWEPSLTVVGLSEDDHQNPALCVLDAAGADPQQTLTCASLHGSASYSAHSWARLGAYSFKAAVTVQSGAQSYVHLFQIGDASYSLYWFFRDGTSPGNHKFRVSTDGGETWGSDVDFFANSTQRPYFQMYQNGANRIDFLCTDGQPSEVTNNIYHFYMLVATDGSRTYYKSDGTLIGTDSALPIGPSNVTKVYDGSVTNAWCWDICAVNGILTAAFTTFASSYTVHNYWIATYSGGAWTTDQVCNGGNTTPNYLYAAEPQYSGGICLDPSDNTSVYVSRSYGATDFRLEKWTKTAGTWAKSVDVSGNTSSVNARPTWIRGAPTTQILYWRGTYTTFGNYSTDIYAYPDLATSSYSPITKPTSPVWHPTQAAIYAAGANGYWPIYEGSGTTLQNLVLGGTNGAFVGTPTWGTGTFGPQLSGWSTSKYVAIDPVSQYLANGAFPYWVAALIINSGTTGDAFIIGAGSTSSNNPIVGLDLNQGNVSGKVTGFVRNNSGGDSSPGATSQPTTDGNAHVVMLVSWATNDIRLYVDGVQKGSVTSSQGTITTNTLSIGVLRRATVALPFGGTIVAVATGSGNAPDPANVADDWLSGAFLAVRPGHILFSAVRPVQVVDNMYDE